jgi:small GTP-binding protein
MSDSKKIVLVGHFGVGKSSLIRRFVMNAFSDDYKVTIGVQILKKEITIEGKNLTFIIWDIEGKEALKQIRPSYLLGTSGFIYVVDPTRETTYVNLNSEIDYLKANFKNAAILSVANKSDLIDIKTFEDKLKQNNLSINFYSSAKNGENVELIFEQLGINLLAK